MLNLTNEQAKQLLQKNGYSFRYLSDEQKKNKELALEAVKESGLALHYIEHFKNDKDVVLEAIKNNYFAIEYMSEDLKNDKDFILEIVSLNENLKIFFEYQKMKDVKRHVNTRKNENFTKTYNK